MRLRGVESIICTISATFRMRKWRDIVSRTTSREGRAVAVLMHVPDMFGMRERRNIVHAGVKVHKRSVLSSLILPAASAYAENE
jgi:hypothetical protein